jgi:alpha-tubulin suppressor-like RCC1 family protein
MYVWGNNDSGQVHGGKQGLVKTPKRLPAGNVGSVAFGSNHTVYVDEYGYVWSAGRNQEGQLGRGNTQASPLSQEVHGELLQHRVVKVAAGANATYAVTASGKLFNWGWVPAEVDKDGKVIVDGKEPDHTSGKLLTAPEESDEASRPTYLQRVLKRSAQAYLMNDPELFVDDEKASANTGILAVQIKGVKVLLPKEVPFPGRRISKVCCGQSHVLVLDHTGACYSRGYNDRGQLGNGQRAHSAKFVKVKFPADEAKRIVDVAVGSQHNLFLREDGVVLSNGSGALGQLGLGPTVSDKLVPTVLPCFFNGGIDIIVAGQYHGLAIARKRRIVYSWGLSEYDIHNTTGRKPRFVEHFSPKPLLFPRALNLDDCTILDAKATSHSTILLMSDSTVVTWGWHASYGLLGCGQTIQIGAQKILGISSVKNIFCGEYNVACVTEQSTHTYGMHFEQMPYTSEFEDVRLVVTSGKDAAAIGGGSKAEFFLHQFIIRQRAPKLFDQHRFADGRGVRGVRTLPIKCSSAREAMAFKALVDYIYTDHCRLPNHLIPHLASLALRYGLAALYEQCTGSSISATNVTNEEKGESVLAGNRGALLGAIKSFKWKGSLRDRSSRQRGSDDELRTIVPAAPTPSRARHVMPGQSRDDTKFRGPNNASPKTSGKHNTASLPSTFTSDFQKMLVPRTADGDQESFDITFACVDPNDGSQTLCGAHRSILAFRVPYFRSLLFGGFAETCKSVLPIDCAFSVFTQILKWIYSGDKSVVNESNVLEILKYAKEKGIDDLMKFSEVFVAEHLDSDNAAHIQEFAAVYGFPRLELEASLQLRASLKSENSDDKQTCQK